MTALDIDQGEFTERITAALRIEFGTERAAAKRLARAANANVRAAQNWLAGRNAPDGLHLSRLMIVVPEVQAEMRRLTAMEADCDPRVERKLTELLNLVVRRP